MNGVTVARSLMRLMRRGNGQPGSRTGWKEHRPQESGDTGQSTSTNVHLVTSPRIRIYFQFG